MISRLTIVGVIAILVISALVFFRETGGAGLLPGCIFRKLTGIECPGCGMTRATYAALHGNFAQAFWFNPVGVIILPLALFALGLELIGWVRGRPLPFRLNLNRWTGIGLATLVIGWGVIRNLI